MKTKGHLQLELILPTKERGQVRGQFFPFSACMELPITQQEWKDSVNNIISERFPSPKNYKELSDILWNQAFNVWSCFSHELMHFCQMLSVPIIMDLCFERLILFKIVISVLRDNFSRLRYPIKLTMSPRYSASNMFLDHFFFIKLNTLHLIECQALYYQLIFDDYSLSEPWVSLIMSEYAKNKIGSGIYSTIYQDLSLFWGVEQAFYLFPLVSWTSLLNFSRKGKTELMTPISQYYGIVDYLSNNPKDRKWVLEKLRKADYNHSTVFEDFLEFLTDRLKFHLKQEKPQYLVNPPSLQFTENEIERGHWFYVFPQAFYYEKALKSKNNLIKFFLQIFKSGHFDKLTEVAILPPIILNDGYIPPIELYPVECEISLDELVDYQLTNHIMEGVLDSLIYENVPMKCPHRECRYFQKQLCCSYTEVPVNFNKCEFPRDFKAMTGVDLDSISDKSNHYASSLSVDFQTLKYKYE